MSDDDTTQASVFAPACAKSRKDKKKSARPEGDREASLCPAVCRQD